MKSVRLPKSVTKIRDEYFDNDGKLSQESLDTLKIYLEGDDLSKLYSAISLVADAGLTQFIPLIAKYFNHEDYNVRELLIPILLWFRPSQYAEIGLKIAQEDEDNIVRTSALSNVGNTLPSLSDQDLKMEIAKYLLQIITDEEEDNDLRRAAYRGIMTGTGLPYQEQMAKPRTLRRPEDLDLDLLENFKEMYGLKPKPRQKLKAKERHKKPSV